MTFIDLFAGIGGFRIAFEKNGAKCVFSAEIDKYACQTYKLNFGENPYYDITKLDCKNIPDFDILCAGFPCQPFSIAGKRKGFEDTRGTLFFDIERIIKNKQPKAFILENVKGLINHDNGNTFKIILNILENKLNYKVYYKVLNSFNYGLPQNRERIYIIGFKNKNINFQFPKPINKKITLKDILSDNDDSSLNISEIAKQNILNNLKKHKHYKEIINNPFSVAYEIRKSRTTFRYDSLSPTLTAKMGTGGNNVPVIISQMRKLSTNECLKIQGFPDNFIIDKNKSQSYKQIGNSVSVPVIELLAKNILTQIASCNNNKKPYKKAKPTAKKSH